MFRNTNQEKGSRDTAILNGVLLSLVKGRRYNAERKIGSIWLHTCYFEAIMLRICRSDLPIFTTLRMHSHHSEIPHYFEMSPKSISVFMTLRIQNHCSFGWQLAGTVGNLSLWLLTHRAACLKEMAVLWMCCLVTKNHFLPCRDQTRFSLSFSFPFPTKIHFHQNVSCLI